MPNHKAAEKHLRTSRKRRTRNMAQKSAARTAIKKILKAQDKDSIQKEFVAVTSKLDRLARKGIVHKNTVARNKSRLAKRVNALGA